MYKVVRVLLWSIGLFGIAIPRAASAQADGISIVGVSSSKTTMYANDDMAYLSVSLEPAGGWRNCTVDVAIQDVTVPQGIGFTITESPGVPVRTATLVAIAGQGTEWAVALTMPSSADPGANTGSGTLVEQFVITGVNPAPSPQSCAVGNPSSSSLFITVLPGSPPGAGGGGSGGGGGGCGDSCATCPDGGTAPEDQRSCSYGYDGGTQCCLLSGYSVLASRSPSAWTLERSTNREFNFLEVERPGQRSCDHPADREDNALKAAGGDL